MLGKFDALSNDLGSPAPDRFCQASDLSAQVERADLARYTQAQLNRIARELNTRPRKTLGYRTPADILAETVASTG